MGMKLVGGLHEALVAVAHGVDAQKRWLTEEVALVRQEIKHPLFENLVGALVARESVVVRDGKAVVLKLHVEADRIHHVPAGGAVAVLPDGVA